MATVADIKEELGKVLYPGFQKSIVDFGFVKDIELIDDESCVITLDITSSSADVEAQLKKRYYIYFRKKLVFLQQH